MVMIDGHLVNNPLRGDAFVNFNKYPVENIKQIEIIRGPGSALYGENAFLKGELCGANRNRIRLPGDVNSNLQDG